MKNYGINILCTERQAERLANEIRNMGYRAESQYFMGQPYLGEIPCPAQWLMAMVLVRGFDGEESLEQFIESFAIKRRGRAPFLYQLKEQP